jgi:YbbR domain-containing protein
MRRNWGIAVAALVLAIFLWLQVNLTKTQRVTISIPIAITNTPSLLIPISIEPETVEVTLEGKGLDMLRYRATEFVYHIDLKDALFGKNFYPFDIGNLEETLKQYDIRIIHEPNIENIVITMDNISSKAIPVKVTFTNEQSREYFISQNLAIEPETVTIKGPKTILEKINEVETLSFDRRKYERNNTLPLLIPQEKYITLEQSEVSIIEQPSRISERTITMVPIVAPQGVEVFPKYLAVKMRGAEEVITTLTPEDFSVVITIDNNVKEGDMVPVTLNVPEGIEIIDQTPQQVRIRILP